MSASDTVNVALPRAAYRKLARAAARQGIEPELLLRRLIEEGEGARAQTAHDGLRAFCGTETAAQPDVSARLDHYMEDYGR
jgi:hypothetical protein